MSGFAKGPRTTTAAALPCYAHRSPRNHGNCNLNLHPLNGPVRLLFARNHLEVKDIFLKLAHLGGSAGIHADMVTPSAYRRTAFWRPGRPHPQARSPLSELYPSCGSSRLCIIPVAPASSRLFQPNLNVAATHRQQPERLARGKRQPRCLFVRIEGPGCRHARTTERAGHKLGRVNACYLALCCDATHSSARNTWGGRGWHEGGVRVGLVACGERVAVAP